MQALYRPMPDLNDHVRPFHFSIKPILALIALWFLLFLEPLSIGPVRLSQIWKAGLIAILIIASLKYKIPSWFFFSLLFSLKSLIYLTMPYGLITAIGNALEALFFPTLLFFIFLRYRRAIDFVNRLHNLSIYIALLFIISAIPFLFGLDSLQPERDLAMWGLDRKATTGLFFSLAASSQVYVASTLLLLASYQRFLHSTSMFLLFAMVVSLGAYLIYFSFTRTGWFIFSGGLLVLLFAVQRVKHKITILALLVIGGISVMSYLVNDEAFMLRMAGGATYRQNVEVGIDPIVNSRWGFIEIAIGNLNSFGVPGWMLGYGDETAKDMFLQASGMRITSHNGIMTTIEGAGLIGLFLYILFLITLWARVSRGIGHNSSVRLPVIMGAYAWMAQFSISHGFFVYGQTVFLGVAASAIISASLRREHRTCHRNDFGGLPTVK